MRLRYEPLAVAHAKDLFPIYADPAMFRYINDVPPATTSELAARFQRVTGGPPPDRAAEVWRNYTVRLIESGVAIGLLDVMLVDGRAELGFMIGRAYWGHGYATEALGWLHEHLRERSGVSSFWATALPENERSVRLLRRHGHVQVSEWPKLGSYHPGDVV